MLARGTLGLIGGGLAVAYLVTNDILAFQIGASTPLIIETFARSPQDDNG